jgi:hypothetical protein
METKPFSIQAPEQVAKDYGGNKQQIARAAQMGLLDPTTAVLAGMFIDRMRQAQTAEQVPTQTVAQQTFAPPAPPAPQGLGATPEAQQMAAAMPAPGQMPAAPAMPQQPVMAAEGGLMSLDVPDDMYDYAGGGIVAFQTGGSTFAGMPVGTGMFVEDSYTTPEEISAYRPFFPGLGAGNRRYKLQQLGYTRAQVDQMSPAQQEFVLQRIAAPSTVAPMQRPATDGGVMPPDVASGEYADRMLKAAGVNYEQPNTPGAPGAPAAGGQPKQPAESFNISNILRESEKLAKGIMPPNNTINVPTVAQADTQISDLLKQSGFDTELLTKQQQQLEEQKSSLSEDRKTAQNMRIIEAGLGIMSGTSANAFENIGKGAAPAIQGLAKDIKELKTVERGLTKAQMDLDTKRNDFALGKAGMTQKVIDKAQDRVDSQAKEYRDLQGNIAKTMVAGEVQKEIARSGAGRITDFDKQWSQYLRESAARGETPTLAGFQTAIGGSRTQLTYKDALEIAAKADPYAEPHQLEAKARQLLAGQQRSMGGAGQYKEGQESKDRTGKPIVFRNGQWVYK